MSSASLLDLPRIAFEAIGLKERYAQRDLCTLAKDYLCPSALRELSASTADNETFLVLLYRQLQPIYLSTARAKNAERARKYTTHIHIEF